MGEQLTGKQLQSKLVAELGEAYRYTTQTFIKWSKRPDNPLPLARVGVHNGLETLYDWDSVLEWLEAEADRLEAGEIDFIATKIDGIQVTLRSLSRELEMHVDTLTARVRAWNVQPVANRTIRRGPVDFYRLRDLLDALTASARAEDPDSLPAQERDAFYRSELRKDELRKSRGELIEIDDARAVLSQIVAVRRDFYDLLVDTLEQRANLAPDHLDLVQVEIDKVRAEEAQALVALHQKLTAPERKAA